MKTLKLLIKMSYYVTTHARANGQLDPWCS